MIRNFGYICICLILISFTSIAQDFSAFKFRNVGPLRGGRVTTVAGTVSETGTFYLGATGAGVWKTIDYGTTWKNVSDGFFKTPSIGAISVDQKDPNIVYAGTGSDGLRSNVIAGKGVYKSVDGGKTWDHIGLENVGQIGAVEIDPENSNIVYVAAIGQAFNSNPERGIYKTIDGGNSWKKILFVSDKTGFADLEFLPGNSQVIYAAAWKAERKPWTIISGGDSSEGGIYKSIDGGSNWNKIETGLPEGLIGKIDLAVSAADSKVLYALIEAPDDKGGVYKSIDQGKSFKLMSNDKGIRSRPFYYTNITADPTKPNKVYVMATGYYRSDDGAKTWKKMTPPHGDNHDMWINPNDPDLFIQANDGGANVTFNGGKTWSSQFNQPTSEIYQVEVDDQFPYWLYGGQQDNYSTIAVPSNPPTGIQAYNVGWIVNTGGCETGPAVPKPGNSNIVYANCKGRFGVYNKLTGTEKAYYVGASNMYGHNPIDLKHRFQRVSPIHVSPHDANVVYHTSQYVHRTKDEGLTWETISPDLTAFEKDKQVISGSPITRDITGEEFYSTIYAIRESPKQKGVIWTGANDGLVYVTTNDGQNWKNVTPPKLPSGGRVDAVEPSPHNAAKAYISVLRYQLGDWKPYIYRTTNYGKSWTLLTTGSNGIPNNFPTRVVREHPSREGLLFAGTEYGIFISMDDGQNWHSFQQNLPIVPITDLKINQGDLVISTMGRGFWIADDISIMDSYNGSSNKRAIYVPKATIRYKSPNIRFNEKKIPQYEKPAVAIYYTLPEKMKKAFRLEIVDSNNKTINTFLNDTTGVKPKTEVLEDMNMSSRTYLVAKSLVNKKGLNKFKWDMKHTGPWHKEVKKRYQNGPMANPGSYRAKLYIDDEILESEFELLLDPRLKETNTTLEDLKEQNRIGLELVDLLSQARKLEQNLNKELKILKQKEQLSEAEKVKKAEIEDTLDKLRKKDITYPQPKLIDQMKYLYYMVTNADQKLGKDVYDQFEKLSRQFEEINKQS